MTPSGREKGPIVDAEKAAEDESPATGPTPLVTAIQITLTEERGHIFGPLDLDLEAGGVTMLLDRKSVV